jgi:hypothetical protein
MRRERCGGPWDEIMRDVELLGLFANMVDLRLIALMRHALKGEENQSNAKRARWRLFNRRYDRAGRQRG